MDTHLATPLAQADDMFEECPPVILRIEASRRRCPYGFMFDCFVVDEYDLIGQAVGADAARSGTTNYKHRTGREKAPTLVLIRGKDNNE